MTGETPKPPQVLLRDGSTVLVRPVSTSDKDLIRAGFDRLSDEPRYRRFLAPTSELTEPMPRYLTEVDHHDHEALVALDPDSGQGVGIARFVRTGSAPNAEVAVTVVDDWQGRGLGTVLLELLAERAREEGVETFSALMLTTNTEIADAHHEHGDEGSASPPGLDAGDRTGGLVHRGRGGTAAGRGTPGTP